MSGLNQDLLSRDSTNLVRIPKLRMVSVIKQDRLSRDWTHLVRVSKLRTMSAMKRPSKPKMPPLAPATAAHLSSNAALKKLPAATPIITIMIIKNNIYSENNCCET